MAARTVERGQHGVNRVLSKLGSSIESGNYYEAHQMYRTLYFRYTSQRKFDECLDLLFNGAIQLLSKQQEFSAADLGLLLVETLEKRGGDNNVDMWIDRLSKIISQLSATTVERETLINRAIKWSGEVSGQTLGHPKLHKEVSQVFWKESNIEQARHHFLLCRDGKLCGIMLINIAVNKGFKSEIDLFIVQAVLQQLCLKDVKTAKETFLTYTTKHPHIKTKKFPYKLPLFNFIHFLFLAINSNKTLDLFRALCEMYKPSLDRDPSYEKYLLKVGVIFFAAPPESTSNGGGLMGGVFGDIFSRLFQGLDDEEEVEVNGHHSSKTHKANGDSHELD